ncbi:MAG: FHA domain-containing protein [Anaerolineales bacterium]|nr:FHA domain-containing protein [Anaerolineales bacterium]
MSTNYALILHVGPDPGRRFDLNGPSLLLGRDPNADILLEDTEVSRRHARLIAQSGGFAIEDLGSTNGTFVNEQPVRTVLPLREGDTIRLGGLVVLRYEAAGAEEEASGMPVWQVAPEPEPQLATEIPAAPLPPAEPEVAVAAPLPAAPAPAEPAAEGRVARRRERRKGLRLPLDKPWVAPVLIAGLLGACALIFFLWYVDANFLWCDVFGGLIPACR